MGNGLAGTYDDLGVRPNDAGPIAVATIVPGDDTVVVADGAWLLGAEFRRSGSDLLAEGPGGVRLCDETPMWRYVLKEAEAQQGGRRLGAFGSRIVGETLHAAIAAASPSMLAGDEGRPGLSWRPDPRLRPSRPDHYGLRDLVAFAGLLEPLPTVAAEV